MLNYMGPNIGPAPVSAMLPPATPGTIPAGVPGTPITPAPVPPASFHKPPAGGKGHSPQAHAAALSAILNHPGGPAAALAPPPPPEYGTTTQDDGSILLHIKGPNGELGPVVKVIPPIKSSGPSR